MLRSQGYALTFENFRSKRKAKPTPRVKPSRAMMIGIFALITPVKLVMRVVAVSAGKIEAFITVI